MYPHKLTNATGKSTAINIQIILSHPFLNQTWKAVLPPAFSFFQLSASPKVLSSNIIDVSFKCGSIPDQVQQMDMSGPSGATTKLNYVCAFTLSSGTSVDLQIKAEEAINVTTARFTIYELL